MSKRNSSMLHLQLGQEVIYLIMAAALVAALIMAMWVKNLQAQLDEARAGKRPDTPPILRLSESDGYTFESGRAEVLPSLNNKLRTDIIPKLVRLSREYNARIVEVIGHTDEQYIGRDKNTTIDPGLLTFLKCQGAGIAPPIASDNAGLGMVRAAAVACALRQSGELKHLTILPYSAGQAILPGDHLADTTPLRLPNAERRRIEIRLRRRPPA